MSDPDHDDLPALTTGAMEPNPLTKLFQEAVRLHQSGHLDRAEAAYHRILEHDPRHADAFHLLGVIDHQRGRDDRAVAAIARAIAMDPAKPTYHNNHGVALRGLGRLDEAIDAYREALRLRLDYADAHSNLGAAWHERGDPGQAEYHLEAALRLQPGHVDALFNLGNLLRDRGETERAVTLYRRALQAAPGRADARNNLGNTLLDLGREDEAIETYREALTLDPGAADAWASLGATLAQQDRVEEAAHCFAEVARLRPHEGHWPIRIAALCPAVFPDVAAIDRYRDGLEAALGAHRADGVRLDPKEIAISGCSPPFNLAHHGRSDRRIKKTFAAVFQGNFSARAVAPAVGRPRVGFVVTRRHEGGFLRGTAGILNRLTPGRFALFLFAPATSMGMIRRQVAHPDVAFVPFPDRFPEAVDRIAEARCDLLYHWQVGTDALNYFLPFARPAPVQCTSWGTHVTSGVAILDYYLSGAALEPPSAQAHYSERLVLLDSLPTFQVRPPAPNPRADRGEFGLPARAHLYACLQRIPKFHPDFDGLLAGVLRDDPAGIAVLVEDRWGYGAARLRERFRASIPDILDRVAFVPHQDPAGYLRLLSLADVVLDTRPYGAGLTAYDVFGLGLPTVTLPGEFPIGRYALACYRAMRIPDLIAATPEHYVALAVRLGTDRGHRDAIAARIATASGVLFEDEAAVREHERFFERAAEEARSGTLPSASSQPPPASPPRGQ